MCGRRGGRAAGRASAPPPAPGSVCRTRHAPGRMQVAAAAPGHSSPCFSTPGAPGSRRGMLCVPRPSSHAAFWAHPGAPPSCRRASGAVLMHRGLGLAHGAGGWRMTGQCGHAHTHMRTHTHTTYTHTRYAELGGSLKHVQMHALQFASNSKYVRGANPRWGARRPARGLPLPCRCSFAAWLPPGATAGRTRPEPSPRGAPRAQPACAGAAAGRRADFGGPLAAPSPAGFLRHAPPVLARSPFRVLRGWKLVMVAAQRADGAVGPHLSSGHIARLSGWAINGVNATVGRASHALGLWLFGIFDRPAPLGQGAL